MTLIEIKPHRWGWKIFEARCRACVPRETPRNRLRAEPRKLSVKRDSRFEFDSKPTGRA
jgi:hypothetical protein